MKHETRKIAYINGYRDGWKDAIEAVLGLLHEEGSDTSTIEGVKELLGYTATKSLRHEPVIPSRSDGLLR